MTMPSPSEQPESWQHVPPHLRSEWNIDPDEARRELLHKVHKQREQERQGRRTERV